MLFFRTQAAPYGVQPRDCGCDFALPIAQGGAGANGVGGDELRRVDDAEAADRSRHQRIANVGAPRTQPCIEYSMRRSQLCRSNNRRPAKSQSPSSSAAQIGRTSSVCRC